MLMDDGLIVTGVRHFSPDMRATLARVYGKGLRAFGRWWITPYHLHVVEQGFVDQFGVFLSREDAWVIADQAGQIRLYNPADTMWATVPRAARVGDTGTLFSEDLY